MRIWDVNLEDGTPLDPAGRMAPLDPMTGEPKVPANALTVAPPETGFREAARAVDGTWEVVPDWRDHVYWLADGSRHEITELGVEPPVDALDEAPPEPLEDLAARKRAEIFASRDAAFAAGMDYTLPDGSADVVQTRPQDQINLLGLGIKAERLVNQGVTDEVMVIRGESNVSHSITPAEMVTLTDAALVYIEDIYQQGWDRKDAITAALEDDALTEDEKRTAIEAVTWSDVV